VGGKGGGSEGGGGVGRRGADWGGKRGWGEALGGVGKWDKGKWEVVGGERGNIGRFRYRLGESSNKRAFFKEEIRKKIRAL